MKTIVLYEIHCHRCEREWYSRNRKPIRCGKCKSPYYATPMKKKGKKR